MRFAFLTAVLMLCSSSSIDAADIARLTEATWEEFAPRGKEVDCIYGDYVIRNDRLIAVIAAPLKTRNANMTVKSVGAMIIDLTTRENPNDQLSCYYANGMPLQFTSPESVEVRASTVKVPNTDDLKVSAKRVEWSATSTSASGLEVKVRYVLQDGSDWLLADTILHNPKSQEVTQDLSDLIRTDRTFEFGEDKAIGLFWANDEWFQQGYGVCQNRYDGNGA